MGAGTRIDKTCEHTPSRGGVRLGAMRPTSIVLGLLVCVLGCGDTSSSADEIGEAETGEATDEASDAGESGEAEAGSSESGSSEDESSSGSETGDACDPSSLGSLTEQDFVRPGEGRSGIALDACTQHLWWTVAPVDAELTISVDASAPVEIAIAYPDAPSFVAPIASKTIWESEELVLVVPRSGELALLVRPLNPADDPSLELSYDLDIACTDNCGGETTRFPLVMVHGWTGFENIGPIQYFYGVRQHLETRGYPVHVAVLDPYNAVEVRGQQLATVVDTALGVHRARKVDVIAHSQGGLDSRRMISGLGYGDRVGGLITVATPHFGTPITDIALGLFPGSSEEALYFLLNLVGAGADQQSDAEASFYSLSETYVQGTFNPTHPDDPRVRYFSWTGETCLTLLTCDDAVDLPILAGYQILDLIAGPNDGLVTVESGKWGEFLGVLPADHFDEIGQVAGSTGPNFDHLQFYLDNARMLRDADL